MVYAKGLGIAVNEPSFVALKKNSGEVVAVGKEAKDMLGRTPGNVPAVKPMNDGVIADFKVTEKMLTYLILKAHNQRALRPRIVIGVPVRLRRWRSVPSRTRRIGRGSATTFWLQEGRSLGGRPSTRRLPLLQMRKNPTSAYLA